MVVLATLLFFPLGLLSLPPAIRTICTEPRAALCVWLSPDVIPDETFSRFIYIP
jgi:hypothetical protein